LDRKLTDPTKSETRWVNQMVIESNRLKELIDEFLQTDRIKGGQLVYMWKEYHLRTVLGDSINEFHFSHPNRLILFTDQLRKTASDVVISDADKLMQVFSNLFDNAAKFSKPDSPIVVTLDFKAPFFTITIRDEGKGIAAEDLPFIFDEYYKVVDKDQNDGMGLGLFLVKNIVDKHHGIIKIDSTVKKGTTVSLKLRRKRILEQQPSVFNDVAKASH